MEKSKHDEGQKMEKLKRFVQDALGVWGWQGESPVHQEMNTREEAPAPKPKKIKKTKTKKRKPRNDSPDSPRYVYRHPSTERWYCTRYYEKIPHGVVEIIPTANLREALILKEKRNIRDGFGRSVTSKAKDRAVDLYTRRTAAYHYNQLIEHGFTKKDSARRVGFSKSSLERWIMEDGDVVYDSRGLDRYGEPLYGNDGQPRCLKRNAGVNGKSVQQMGFESPRKPKVPNHIRYYGLLVKSEELARKGISLWKAMEKVSLENKLKKNTLRTIHETHRVHEIGAMGSRWSAWNDTSQVTKWYNSQR
jgi:hypothetical protein